MNFQEIFENVKEKVLEFIDRISEYYEENKTKALIIAGSVISFLIILVIILALAGKTDKKEAVIKPQLELSEKPVVPNGPVLPRDYNISRKTKDKWTDEDADEWFTVPSDKEIETLSKSNDAIINEIIGAAP